MDLFLEIANLCSNLRELGACDLKLQTSQLHRSIMDSVSRLVASPKGYIKVGLDESWISSALQTSNILQFIVYINQYVSL